MGSGTKTAKKKEVKEEEKEQREEGVVRSNINHQINRAVLCCLKADE